jgi:phosphate/sulfate permease
MIAYRALVTTLLLHCGVSFASGWNDYSLEIAPGFWVYRMNSFEVCLGKTDGKLLICPDEYPGIVGPLIEYAITNELIITRHVGVRPNESNPTMSDGDPTKEYYFATARADHRVVGPLTRAAWEQSKLPNLTSLQWVTPENPNFWVPFIGNVTFLLFALVFWGWPVIVAAVLLAISVWLYRRWRKGPNAA